MLKSIKGWSIHTDKSKVVVQMLQEHKGRIILIIGGHSSVDYGNFILKSFSVRFPDKTLVLFFLPANSK